MKPKILDACCGSRMWHYDKNNKNVIFMDERELKTTLCDGRSLVVSPDIIGDFRNMPFDDEEFYTVLFDPPHLRNVGDTSYMAQKYGRLTCDWQEDLRKGFAECFRVLKPHGTLIFKWNEEQIKLKEVLCLSLITPICGTSRGGKNKDTHFVVFVKGV